MDIKQLRYFLTIAEEGQITAAARRLHIAQPPLSQQLKLLERELGVKLVERGPRHIHLTDAGEILRTRAEQILELSDSTINEIDDFKKGLNGTLSIGMVSSSGALLIKNTLSKFHEEYPGVKFSVQEGNTFKILELLNRGIIEVGIVRTPFKALNCNCKHMVKEPMIAAMTKKYSSDLEGIYISLKELNGKPLIFYRRFEQLIIDTCTESGFKPEVFCKNDDARTTLMLANAGFGIGIVPKSAFELSCNENLIYKEIKNEKLETSLAAIWIKDRYVSSLADRFIKFFN
ncbi:LysR family transcriptional regulator [Clostridium estertheticum]|uniref:LysR family transcriptional regulator n=1 Tax=Clostridium estertheticum TaxID=238834 RepID=A0A7Y3SV62_9CLOT|nr:LysR family transcriptional regulator [Clostridium estertheticum]NNU75956.1 LysR family transcriptional regulator [Clostridium estertheticum]WBL46631.1 LysR family transcriptional regulator [Clostridium estertheticum]